MKSGFLAASFLGMLFLFTGIGWAENSTADNVHDDVMKVRLQDDGRLSGRLRVFYATGKSEPANAEISVLHDGNVLDTTMTDERGHFHFSQIEPGDYVARAAIDTGTTDFEIDVVAYEAGASADEMFLDATLTPTPDEEIIEGELVEGEIVDGEIEGEVEVVDAGIVEDGIIGDEIVGECDCGVEGCDCEEPVEIVEEEIIEEEIVDMGFSGGGCCGGGGGGGLGLVGLAGLAGLAGLDGGGDGGIVFVSPAAPGGGGGGGEPEPEPEPEPEL